MDPPVPDSLAPRIRALTAREKETLRLLLRGHDAKSIAHDLGLSVHTVNERLRDARRKLNVTSSREAARQLAEEERDSAENSADKFLGVTQRTSDRLQSFSIDPRRDASHRLAWLTGGMLVMSLVIAAAALLLAFQGHGGAGAEGRPQAALVTASPGALDPAATSAAREWVTLLDNSRWEESWRASATQFRSKLSAKQWTSMIQPIRQALGPPSSRTVQSATEASSLPGAPAGDYEVIQFQTNFANRPGAVETVALRHEKSNWKVSGYYIR